MKTPSRIDPAGRRPGGREVEGRFGDAAVVAAAAAVDNDRVCARHSGARPSTGPLLWRFAGWLRIETLALNALPLLALLGPHARFRRLDSGP